MNLPPEGVVGKCCKIYSAIYLVKWAVDRGEKHIVETFEVLTLDSSCKLSNGVRLILEIFWTLIARSNL